MKKTNKNKKKLNEEKNNISEIQKSKKLIDNLCTKYQKRIKQFFIDVSFILVYFII